MSRTLIRAARKSDGAERNGAPDPITIGELIQSLGDRSFGWSLLLFGLFNLIPMPIGSNMITALPLLWLTGQMAIGFDYVHLPQFLTRRSVDRRAFKKVVMRLRPAIARIERIIHPRMKYLFTPYYERLMGIFLFVVAFNLFLPIPLSGYIPATSIFVTSFGLIERDGWVTVAGLVIGAISILVTTAVVLAFVFGFDAIAHHGM